MPLTGMREITISENEAIAGYRGFGSSSMTHINVAIRNDAPIPSSITVQFTSVGGADLDDRNTAMSDRPGCRL